MVEEKSEKEGAQQVVAIVTEAGVGAQKRRRRATGAAAKKAKRVVVASKRKTAIARASVAKGSGRVMINNISIDLIEPKEIRSLMLEPLKVSSLASDLASGLDIKVNVKGGGVSAQAQAVRGAVARGIAAYADTDTIKKEYMRYDVSLLVNDARRVEPKKFKGPKARTRFQKSKR
jgi:small subunit ribosomal protein S9